MWIMDLWWSLCCFSSHKHPTKSQHFFMAQLFPSWAFAREALDWQAAAALRSRSLLCRALDVSKLGGIRHGEKVKLGGFTMVLPWIMVSSSEKNTGYDDFLWSHWDYSCVALKKWWKIVLWASKLGSNLGWILPGRSEMYHQQLGFEWF